MAAETSGSQGGAKKENVAELLARLNLQEEEDDDFVWEDEVIDKIEPAMWLAIARVHTPKTFSPSALYADMRSAWNPAKPIVWRRINENLFTAQFGCLADWKKAMFDGPWLFHGHGLIMAEYDGFKHPETVKLDRLAVWAQIHKLPDNYLCDAVVRGMSKRIGEVEEIQLKLPAGFFGEYVRVRLKIDVTAKIKRFVSATKAGEKIYYQVKYEKLPTFCHNCGEFGHWYEECGDGDHDESKFEWGDFILADNRRTRLGEAGRGNMEGRGGGRSSPGGFRGRGRGRDTHEQMSSWRFNAYKGEKSDENLNVDARTGSQDAHVDDLNILGKRIAQDSNSLPGNALAIISPVGSGVLVPVSNTTHMADQFDGNGNTPAGQSVTGTLQKNANKKLKGIDGLAIVNSTHDGSGASSAEDRREQ